MATTVSSYTRTDGDFDESTLEQEDLRAAFESVGMVSTGQELTDMSASIENLEKIGKLQSDLE
jgi:hypothetical protein